MKIKVLTIMAVLISSLLSWGETVLSTDSLESVPVDTTFVDGSSISSAMRIDYGPVGWDEGCVVTLNGTELLSSDKRGSFTWQPRKTGLATLVWSSGDEAMTSKVNVASLSYAVAPTPNPPMSKDTAISITPTTRNFPVGGGGNAIITSGSGTWTAAVSDPWLTLSATSGSVGTPVAYTVSASTNIGQRVGYVYVAGHTHTVTQDGYVAEVSPTEITAESGGKTGTITLDSPGRYAWDACPNNDWLSITPTHGVASGTLTYRVAPYNEVATRSGSFTVGGQTINVFQYGRRMKLSQYSSSHDYFPHAIALTVNALAITSWSVTPNASWISVVDAGNGKGGDTVGLAIGENPSWKARTGTVTIGTETYTITQEGRTALEFKLNPTTATAAVAGGNGLLAVLATPDLPWTAKSESNWLTVLGNYVSGAGNGNIVYNASPNSTLVQRTGKITVTPGDSSLNAKTLTVTQPAATASIDKSGYEFEAAGESVSVTVTVNDIVEWSVVESLDWITVAGSTSRVGPGSVTISASANNTIYPRKGTVKIAGKTFSVSQKARGVEVEYDSKVFGTDGGMESISIHPDGNVAWTAVASDSWIVIFQNASGTGDAEILYILAPYEGDGSPRTGWITIGDKKVYITQRAYDLDITPRAATVSGNNGAGEIGVSAGIDDVWQAIICNADWITIVTGYDAGTGSGTVRFTYTENNTGKTRTGKILISGEEYTLTQAARVPVPVTTSVEGHGGTVSGGGEYTLGDTVTLTASPDSGYEFLYWTGSAGETMQNPLRVTADVAKSFTAHFGPLTPEFTKVETSTEGVTLTWSALAWATQYKIYRAPTSEFPTVALVTLQADSGSTYKDTSGAVGQSYFYWVEAIGANDRTECKDAVSGAKQKPIVWSDITYTNLKGATHGNPATYQEGTLVSFTAPSAVAGYTFTGWTPGAITATMTGAQAVMANWKANAYTIAYNANGGSGTMAGTSATYDQDATLASNGFTYAGYVFKGWATDTAGAVAYADGATVRNLSALQGRRGDAVRGVGEGPERGAGRSVVRAARVGAGQQGGYDDRLRDGLRHLGQGVCRGGRRAPGGLRRERRVPWRHRDHGRSDGTPLPALGRRGERDGEGPRPHGLESVDGRDGRNRRNGRLQRRQADRADLRSRPLRNRRARARGGRQGGLELDRDGPGACGRQGRRGPRGAHLRQQRRHQGREEHGHLLQRDLVSGELRHRAGQGLHAQEERGRCGDDRRERRGDAERRFRRRGLELDRLDADGAAARQRAVAFRRLREQRRRQEREGVRHLLQRQVVSRHVQARPWRRLQAEGLEGRHGQRRRADAHDAEGRRFFSRSTVE